MEVNELETRNFNRTITFVLQNVFRQPVANPFAIINNIEQELIEFTLEQSLHQDEALEENENIEINEPLILYEKVKGKDEECSICMDVFEDKDKLFKCKCNNMFHYACINKWIKSKEDCPICRTKINTRIEMDDYFLDWINYSLDL